MYQNGVSEPGSAKPTTDMTAPASITNNPNADRHTVGDEPRNFLNDKIYYPLTENEMMTSMIERTR